MFIIVALLVISHWVLDVITHIPDMPIGRSAFIGVTAFLFAGFVVNANGTPPPSVTALWMMALGLGGLTLWLAWFADRHRRSRT